MQPVASLHVVPAGSSRHTFVATTLVVAVVSAYKKGGMFGDMDSQQPGARHRYPLPLPNMFSTFFAALVVASGAIASPACALVARSSTHTPRASISSPLFPVSPQLKYWTTDSSLPSPSPLSDATFRPHNQITALAHPYVNAPDGELSMKAHYPAGSFTFSNTPQGGISFYAPGPASVDLTTAKEATFGYSVYFPSGFQFVKGGKLPGLCMPPQTPCNVSERLTQFVFPDGGDSDSEAVSCSGGRRDDGCFSARLMWRTNGAGQENGELELFANGKSVVNVGGLVLRNSSAGRIRGIQMQTFFGGESRGACTPGGARGERYQLGLAGPASCLPPRIFQGTYFVCSRSF